MGKTRKFSRVAIAIAICIGVVSCGGGGGGTSAGGSSPGSVSGAAAKGIIQNGVVTLRDAAGNVLQTTVSPILTGTDGSYTATLSNGGYAGPVFVEISAGSTTLIQNEVTGDFESASGLSGALLKSVGNITAGQPVSINATPFTSIIADLVERSRGTGSATSLLVQQAQAVITTTLGFNPVSTPPLDPRDPDTANASEAEKKQAILLAALAQLGTDPTNTTCNGENTTAAKLICASEQLTSAYATSTIANNSGNVVIDGSLLQGFTSAIATVSADLTINQTGTTVDPTTDPATNEIAAAEQSPTPTTTTVAAPVNGFNESDVVAVKTLFNNLRSNAAALGNDELNGPVETQLANFGDSITTQATGLETGPFEVTEATATGIELWQTHQAIAAGNPAAVRPVISSAGPSDCLVLSAVTRDTTSGVVNGVTFANETGPSNAAFIGCIVYGDGAGRAEGAGFVQLRNYVLLTPTSTTNTFRVESDSRFCDISFDSGSESTDQCLALENASSVITAIGGSGAATASGGAILNAAGDITGIRGSFSGMVPPPVELSFNQLGVASPVELADTTNVAVDFTATSPAANTARVVGSGSFTTTTGQQSITTALSSFTFEATEDPNTFEVSGSFNAAGRVETQLGALRGSFAGNSTNGSIEFSGAVDLKNGSTVSTLFEGAVTLAGISETETNSVLSSALFEGTLRLPERPVLTLELQVTNALFSNAPEGVDTGTVSFTYQQNGTTVIVNASRNAQGVETVSINSPTSMVSVAAFDPNSAQAVSVLRDGRVAATYNVANARVDYVDGSFEQF